jgi:hypothetical protein
MKRKIATALAIAALAVPVGATAASAAPQGAGGGGKPVGIACQQHGLSLLRSLGAPSAVSQEVVGLPLNQVLALHRNDPQAAAGVLTSLGLPAGPCDVSAS